METSAKAGHNVKSLFKKIAMSLVGMEKEGEAAEAQNASMYLVSAHFFPVLAPQSSTACPCQRTVPACCACFPFGIRISRYAFMTAFILSICFTLTSFDISVTLNKL